MSTNQTTVVLDYFKEISKIPRGSTNMKGISKYICDFATKNNLKYYNDKIGNVIVYKPASKGYENAKPIILQAHLDMVCVSTDPDRDFNNKGIDLVFDGDILKADGTSLGGDDGVGICMMLGILADKEACHPSIEAVFTADEEIGLIGAGALDYSKLSAKTMINLDCGGEGTFTVSCAGGATLTGDFDVERICGDKYPIGLEIKIDGLLGGHSGAEIHKGRANANILCIRLLNFLLENGINFAINSTSGGEKDNAIASYCNALICVANENDANKAKELINTFESIVLAEYKGIDDKIKFAAKQVQDSLDVFDNQKTNSIVKELSKLPNGVYDYSEDIEGLVETSSNLGIMAINDNTFSLTFSIRSSKEEKKQILLKTIASILEKCGASNTISGEYPGWEYKKDSQIRDIVANCYRELYNKEPVIEAIHAGLECGLFAGNIDDFDCIAMAPDEYDVHTPYEALSVSSLYRTYDFLREVLKRIK